MSNQNSTAFKEKIPIILYTYEDEDGLAALGATIWEEDLTELINGEVILKAINQLDQDIKVHFDMDSESLIIELLDINQTERQKVLSREELRNLIFAIYKPKKSVNADLLAIKEWQEFIVDKCHKTIKADGHIILEPFATKCGKTVKILPNGGLEILD